jgi:anti-sigma B factor antagonist
VTPAGRPGGLDLRDSEQDGCHTLSLVGELDLVTAPELQETIDRLCRDGAREIVLDLQKLAFIDSTGLRVILSSSQLCERRGCDFSLTRVQPPAQRLLELTGVVGRLSFRGRALARRLSRRRPTAGRMPVDLFRPDFEVWLNLDSRAPASARDYVRDLVRADASQDLREAVMLLTSELVTRTVLRRTSVLAEPAELKVWLRAELVRVELRLPGELLIADPERSRPHYDKILLDQLADRWSIEAGQGVASAWFEIDRDGARSSRTDVLGPGGQARPMNTPPLA